MDERLLYVGLIRLHVLHHAVQGPIYGLAMIEQLGRHGLPAERRHDLSDTARA